MIKGRQDYILNRDAFTAARTKTESIQIVDPISAIDIILEMTNGSAMTESSVVKPHDEVTLIEVINGSDILFSASMEEGQGLNLLETGKLPFMLLTLEDNAVQREKVTLFFGRYLNDPDYYINPSDFKNLQLRITNTLTTPAVTAWAASGHYVSAIAHILESGYNPSKGFMQSKSMYGYTVVNGAVERVDIPTEFVVRAMMVQSLMSTYGVDESISNFKLNCDSNKFSPFDISGLHLQMQNTDLLGQFQQFVSKRITGAGTIYGDLYYNTSAVLSQDTDLSHPGLCVANAESIGMAIDVGAAGVDANSAVEGLVQAILHGSSLHSCVYMPLGYMKYPDTWFRALDYKNIELELTGAAALGVTKVLCQEVRTS